MNLPTENEPQAQPPEAPKPLNPRQRRILGVLIEKARTTPDSYPLSLNGLVTGCNQKSNRSPLMSLSPEQVEDELIGMRELGIVAEVHGGGRVPKYRHFGYDYMGVKGVEAGIMTELLLRGEQSVGDLRSRASRFEAIADANTLLQHLDNLSQRKLVVALTPPGRGQIYTHNLYSAEELEHLKRAVSRGEIAAATSAPSRAAASSEQNQQVQELKTEVAELRELVQKLSDRLDRLES